MESKSAIHKMSLSIKYVFWHLAPFLVVSLRVRTFIFIVR